MVCKFVEAMFYSIDQKGNVVDLRIEIDSPHRTDKGDFVTEITFTGITPLVKKYCIVGVDPIMSLLTAIGFIKGNIQHFEKEGGQIFLSPLRTEESRYTPDVWIMIDQVSSGVPAKLRELLQEVGMDVPLKQTDR
jgi:hypothetical protein